jgi:hypothetical protein
MSEYDPDIDSDEDGPIRVNFAGVPEKKVFYLLPPGKYIAEITDFSKSFASDEAENSGALMINWEFTIESTDKGDTEIEGARVRNPETRQSETADLKVEGRRVFDNMVIVEGSMWRLRDLLDACWYDTSGELEVYPEVMVGNRLILELTVQPAKKDRKSGKEYKGRNRVANFLQLAEERPADVPAPEATKSKAKAKAKEDTPTSDATEEAKV